MIKIRDFEIDAVIFDMDGTLLDSLSVWTNLAQSFLESKGIEFSSDLCERIKAMSVQESAVFLKNELNAADSPEEIVNGVREKLIRFYAGEARFKDGAYEFLEKLKEAGVKMCICTANDEKLAHLALKANNAEKFFSDIICMGKHDSKGYDKCLEKLGAKKETCMVFEDAYYATKTAKEAGYKVCGVYDRHEKENIKPFCDIYINSFDEIL